MANEQSKSNRSAAVPPVVDGPAGTGAPTQAEIEEANRQANRPADPQPQPDPQPRQANLGANVVDPGAAAPKRETQPPSVFDPRNPPPAINPNPAAANMSGHYKDGKLTVHGMRAAVANKGSFMHNGTVISDAAHIPSDADLVEASEDPAVIEAELQKMDQDAKQRDADYDRLRKRRKELLGKKETQPAPPTK